VFCTSYNNVSILDGLEVVILILRENVQILKVATN